MNTPQPQYNDNQIDEVARRVTYLALTGLEKLLVRVNAGEQVSAQAIDALSHAVVAGTDALIGDGDED